MQLIFNSCVICWRVNEIMKRVKIEQFIPFILFWVTCAALFTWGFDGQSIKNNLALVFLTTVSAAIVATDPKVRRACWILALENLLVYIGFWFYLRSI